MNNILDGMKSFINNNYRLVNMSLLILLLIVLLKQQFDIQQLKRRIDAQNFDRGAEIGNLTKEVDFLRRDVLNSIEESYNNLSGEIDDSRTTVTISEY
jgi:hypothetical protein